MKSAKKQHRGPFVTSRTLLRLAIAGGIFGLSLTASRLPAREKDGIQYGVGVIVNVPFPEGEVAQVVQDVVQNGIIRGTKEYNKDEFIQGATPVSSTRIFPQWTEGGQVFYKVRFKALDPRNFKDSSDVGTLAVRYVLQPQGDHNTVLRIDARFVEDFRHVAHASNGSVESAEYKDIHDRLDALSVMKVQTLAAEKEKEERREGKSLTGESSSAGGTSASNAPDVAVPISTPAAVQKPPQTLDQRVHDLRGQVERLVKSPGAPLKSAPFHTASTLQSLPAGTEVLIVIATPYWLGVETHDGQHGWMLREQLEQVP